MEAGNSATTPPCPGNASKDTRLPHLASVGPQGSAIAGSSSLRCPSKHSAHVRNEFSKRNFPAPEVSVIGLCPCILPEVSFIQFRTVGAKGGVVLDDDPLCCYTKDGTHAGCDDKAPNILEILLLYVKSKIAAVSLFWVGIVTYSETDCWL